MKLLFMVVLAFNIKVYAVNISFIGACNQEPLASTNINIDKPHNVGSITLNALNKLKAPYKGTKKGMNSIFNSPTGLEALEVLSDEEMMSYGWCYSVNGVSPEELSDQIFAKNSDKVMWYFGYAHYKKGEWISQCNPSYLRKSKQFCPDSL